MNTQPVWLKVFAAPSSKEQESKYLFYGFKKSTNLGKMHFLTKIHNQIDVSGSPVTSNCGTPIEKASEHSTQSAKAHVKAKILVIF